MSKVAVSTLESFVKGRVRQAAREIGFNQDRAKITTESGKNGIEHFVIEFQAGHVPLEQWQPTSLKGLTNDQRRSRAAHNLNTELKTELTPEEKTKVRARQQWFDQLREDVLTKGKELKNQRDLAMGGESYHHFISLSFQPRKNIEQVRERERLGRR